MTTEPPAGTIVRKLEFDPAPPHLNRTPNGIVVKVRYRGDLRDRLSVVDTRTRRPTVHPMAERWTSSPYRYLEARLPPEAGPLGVRVRTPAGQEAWWSPATGLGPQPVAIEVAEKRSPSRHDRPTAVLDVPVGPRVRRWPRPDARAALMLRFPTPCSQTLVGSLLEHLGEPVWLRLRDTVPDQLRALLGGPTPPLFSGTEELLRPAGVRLVAAAGGACLARVRELVERGVLAGLVVDWADQLPRDFLNGLRDAVAGAGLVLDGVQGRDPWDAGLPTTAAGRVFWPVVADDPARAGEAWLRLPPAAFDGWRPRDAADATSGVPVTTSA